MTIIVLFGGCSDERHVSVASAQNVVRNLAPLPAPRGEGPRSGAEGPLCWFQAPNGAVHDVGIAELLRHENPFIDDYVPSRPAIWPDLEQALDTLPVDDPLFVLALHGGEGEDGTVQRMMEERGIPFTGSGSEASALALDKSRAKERLRGRVPLAESRVVIPSRTTAPHAADGLMTRPSPGLRPPSPRGRGISAEVSARRRLIEILLPPGEGARSADDRRVIGSMSEGSGRAASSRAAPDPPDPSLTLGMTVTDMLQRHEKLVLKPLIGGSSRGLFFVTRGDPIPEISVPYIVEQFIAGRELTVGVLDGVALPVIEIEVDPGFEFDYAGKYLGKGTHEICPADIPDAMRDEAQRVAVAAHEGLGCAGCSRTDVIAAADGTVYFIELNTLPGLTTSSLVPQQLRAAGISMREFLEREITSAARRRSRAPRSSR